MKTKAVYISRALLLALALLAVSASAKPQAQPDLSKTEVKSTRITQSFYTIEGQGGVIGVLVGPDGVFMMNSQYAPLTDKIVAAVKQISNAPIRFVLNMHVDPDYTGGNENLAKMGATILARDEVRNRLAAGSLGTRPPAPPAALPLITYQGKVTLYMNGETVQLIPIARAHTDGDTIVGLPQNNLFMTGDVYCSVGYPNIDRANGGSLNGVIQGLTYIVNNAGPDTRIIPGRGPTATREKVRLYREMIVALRDKVAQLIQQGKSVQDVIAAHPTADYDAAVPQAAETADRFVGQLYAEIKAHPAGSGQ